MGWVTPDFRVCFPLEDHARSSTQSHSFKNMKTTHFFTSVTLAQGAFAQGLRQATGGPEPTTTIQRYPTPTPEVSDCTANLITTLCDYKDPGPSFAVASSGKKHCWEYCNAHQPCNFVIFAAGNPYTGTGTCWLYPGETFDESAGEKGCDHLSVFDKPVCPEPTPTEGDCAATASPSAVAEVCDYAAPETCFSTCTASEGAVSCLSQCAEREACSYVVFVPQNPDGSPYSSGMCWMYEEDEFDASKAGTCSGKPAQFVYKNPCPKPPKAGAKESSKPSSPASPEKSGSPSAEGAAAEPSAEGDGGVDTTAEPASAEGAATGLGFSVGALLIIGMTAFFIRV